MSRGSRADADDILPVSAEGNTDDILPVSASDNTDDYPALYTNLTEIAAPPPEQNPEEREWNRRLSLEDSRARHSLRSHQEAEIPTFANLDEVVAPSEYANLDEIAAPPPEQNPQESEWYRHLSLERSRSRSSQIQPVRRFSKRLLIRELYTHSYLIIFSIFGTMARLGVMAITQYPNEAVIFTELWANVGGSFVIGFLQEEEWLFATSQPRFEQNQQQSMQMQDSDDTVEEQKHMVNKEGLLKLKKGIPFYIGLSVGFCGSFTTFSSFMRDAFLALSNDLVPYGVPQPASRSPGWSVVAVLAVIITETGLSLSSLSAGAHFAIALNPWLPKIPQGWIQKLENPLIPLVALGFWVGAILMTAIPPNHHHEWRGQVLFALDFAPVGCLLRFHLSTRLNGLISGFPVGTFTANILGTMILAMCWDLQRAPLSVTGGNVAKVLGCQVLQGVQDGFCACLTTVSTWVSELKGLRRRNSYVYGITSIVVALSCMIVIVGPLKWTHRVESTSCRL